MLVPKPIKNYNCTQAELYAIAAITLDSFEQNLTSFTAFKTIYTPTYHTDKVAELNAAMALPDLQQRDEPVEIARLTLKNKANECLAAWQALKSYITSTFGKEQAKVYLESAGAGYYLKASNYNWEILIQMLQTASTFIAEHSSEMINADIMPVGFPSSFETMKEEAKDFYTDFKNKEQTFEEKTAAKIIANNGVYESIITIMKDGQKIFRNNAAVRERFVFKKVKAIVTPPDSTVKIFQGQAPSLQPVEVVLTDVDLNATGTRLSFYNMSLVPSQAALIFYFAASPTEVPSASGSNSFYLTAGESITNLTPMQAGYSIVKPLLLVYSSTNINGSYKVEARK